MQEQTQRLRSLNGESHLDVRQYQQELLEEARAGNVVAFLETGSGKTLISALLAKEFLATHSHKRIVMLVPTKLLVPQQAGLFRSYVAAEIGEYTGDRGVDVWTPAKWSEEIRNHKILIMTPKILDDLLMCGNFQFREISLLIFDEAHHCSKGHPYAQIMRKYAEVPSSERPHIFGMTASPVNTNVKSREKLLSSIAALEQLMDCTLVTIHDEQLEKLQQTVPMPETDSFEFTIPTFSAHHNRMVIFAVQQLLRDQKLLEMTRQHGNLRRKLVAFGGASGPVVSLDDRGPLNRAEAVGDWLVNKLCFALLHQGPFCAALVLQDYCRNCSSDGRLSTLGNVGAETQFYAAARAAMTGRKSPTPSGTPTSTPPSTPPHHDAPRSCDAIVAELHALNHRIVAEMPELAGRRMPSAEECLRSALLRAVLLCVRMLVSDPVLADCLSAQARRLLFAREPAPAPDPSTAKSTEPAAAEPAAFVDTNTHAIAAVLEAGLHAVPAEILQECVLLGPGSRRAAAWSRHMLCDLVTDKVSRALAHLYDAGRQAQEKQPGSKWAALVFAERQSCSLAMDLVVRRTPALAAVLRTGTLKSRNALMSTTHQGEVISRFRHGALNALFCTSVAEEGLDIQQCSLVICYDVPKRPLSMVQTVGRARSRGSRVFFMRAMQASGKKAQDNMDQMAHYTQQMRRAVVLRETIHALHTPQRPLNERAVMLGDKSIDGGRARSMLSQYVQALAHWKGRWHDLLSGHKSADRKSREIRECEPRYSTHRSAEGGTPLFQVTLHLPPSAPLHHVTGDRCPTRAAAKDSAVLRGISALWGKGVFGDNLRPTPPKALLDLEEEMEADDENPNEWRARQTLRRPQQFTVTQQPPLALDLRHAPLDDAAAVDSCCFVATQLHLYAFDLTPENNAESPGGAGGDAGGGGWGGEELGEGGFPRMCLGLLLLQRLPELPAFPVYEAPRAEGGEMVVYRCQLRYCRTLDLSMEQVAKAQRFHCKMVQTARGNKGQPPPLSPQGAAEAISNETWGESSGGAFYIIVPVCAAGGGAGKAHKRRRDAGPNGAAPFDLDERSIDSALHPTAHDDQSAEELHAHLQQLRERRLDPEATEAQREEAGERMHELLAGRVLTTLHRPAIAYRFRGFSSFTISDPFPDGRQGEYRSFLEYYTKRYGYEPSSFDPRAPLLLASTATSAVKDINCLAPPRPQTPFAAALLSAAADHAAGADAAAVDPEGVPLKNEESPAAAGANARVEAAREGLERAALRQGSATARGADEGVIDLVSSDEGSEGAAPVEGGGVAEAAGAGPGGGAAAAPAPPRRQHEVHLPLELCRVHRLKEELLRSLQFLPGLLYRVEGLLVAHEVWVRLSPPWMPRPVRQPAFTLKVLEALTPQGTRDVIDSERYELLGDGVLKGMAARHVFQAGRGDEGQMSLALCRLVSNGTLHRVAVWTKDVRSKTAPAYTAANRHQRSITESVRAFPYGRALWRPPGFELHFKPEEALLAGKKSADALEALIGVVFEAAGEDATEAWLAWLGVLPNHKGDPKRLPQEPDLKFLTDVKAAAVAAVAAARAVPRARLTGRTGKEATLPAKVQLWRGAGREDRPPRPPQQATGGAAAAESAEDIAAAAAAEQRNMSRALSLEGQFGPVQRVNVAQEKVQEKLRAIIGEPEMLLQMNSALQAAPAALPAPAAAPPDVARALHAHLQDGGWRHIAQQRRAAERLAASTAATTAKTFRPREVRERPELTLEAILGYEFKNKALAESCLVHSSFVHESGEQDRLEFLGDAMLGTCVTAFLFYCLDAGRRQDVRPEQLHGLRATLVQNDTLAFMAVFWGLERHLRHSSTHLGNAINAFKAVVQEKLEEKEAHEEGRHMGIMQYLLTAGGWDMQTMDHPKALGDILEAALGAVTLDCAFDMPQILQAVLKVLDGLRGVSPEIMPRNPVSVLHEVISKLLPTLHPQFEYVEQTPPAEGASGPGPQDGDPIDVTTGDENEEVRGRAYIWLPGAGEGAAAVRRDLSDWFCGASRRKVKALCAEDALRRLSDSPGLLVP